MGARCARRTRTMKQCSSNARTWGTPPTAPWSPPATRMERERKGARWTRAVWPSPATCPKKTTGHEWERGTKRLMLIRLFQHTATCWGIFYWRATTACDLLKQPDKHEATKGPDHPSSHDGSERGVKGNRAMKKRSRCKQGIAVMY